MGSYVSNIIGIKTGNVFAGSDIDELTEGITKVVQWIEEDGMYPTDIPQGRLVDCMSLELNGSKGSFVVIAGVFNYWNYDSSSQFAKKLSEELDTIVMHMCWHEGLNVVQCQIWRNGKAGIADSLVGHCEFFL